MSSPIGWTIGSQITIISGTGALANGSTQLSSAFNNSGNGGIGFERIRLTLNFTPGGSIVASNIIPCWLIKDSDGTGAIYEDGTTGSPGVTPARGPDVIFVPESGTASEVLIMECEWPAGHTQALLLNQCGQQLNSGWTLKGLPISRTQ